MHTYLNRWKQHWSVDSYSVFQTFLLFAGMIAIAGIISDGLFLQPKNLLNLTFQNSILMLIALGQFLVILCKGIDLSVGAIVAISSVIVVQYQDYGIAVAITIAILVSIVIGIVNGYFIAYRGLPSFIVTLAMMQIVQSVAKVISGGSPVYNGLNGAPIAPGLTTFFSDTFLGIPNPIWLILCAIVGVSLILRTSYGFYMYAVGGNKRAAALSGVPVRVVEVFAYVLSAVLACIGAILFVARVGMGNPQAGEWLPLDSIAAVVIGGASLAGGIGTVIGSIMGVYVLSTLNNIMNLMNVSPTFQPAVKGAIILLAVYLNSRRKIN